MINSIFSLILISFPFIIVSGTFLTNLSISLLALYYVLSLNQADARKFLNNSIVKLIAIFWIYIIVCSFFSQDIPHSLKTSLLYGRFLLFSLGTAYLIKQNKKIVFYFGLSLWVCLLILTFDGFFQFFNDKNIFGWEKVDPLRISSFFGDELVLGNFLARLMPLAFFFISITTLKNKTFFIFLGLTILMLQDILIFISGERTAFLLLIMGSLMIIFLIPNFRVIRAVTFFISCLLIILVTTQFSEVKERMIDHTFEEIGLGDENEGIVIFSPGHQDHFMTAYEMFIDSPIVGHGPKMFRNICSSYDSYLYNCATHPHNTYLQLLAEVGILGAIPIISIFIYISFILIRHLFSMIMNREKFIINESEIFLLICFTITLWPFAPTFGFFSSWINSIYYLPLGFYLYQVNNDSKN